MRCLGFSDKWCAWIDNLLKTEKQQSSSMASPEIGLTAAEVSVKVILCPLTFLS
jgi:hypothetical protein